jgi:hypothetical protein
VEIARSVNARANAPIVPRQSALPLSLDPFHQWIIHRIPFSLPIPETSIVGIS